jgi:tRNA threonylcarbamoyladenosine biosynthesis protein TsaE
MTKGSCRTYEVNINNVGETLSFAERLAKQLFAGSVVALDGELGAGKTTFTQGLARGLEIGRVVNSPTFTIIKEYAGRLKLNHMDVYRLADGYSDIDFDEYFYGDGVTVVEWGTIIDELLPAEYLAIEITRAEGYGNGAPGFTEDGYGVGTSGGLAEEYGVVASEKRIFRLTPHGKRYQEICEVLINSENSSS